MAATLMGGTSSVVERPVRAHFHGNPGFDFDTAIWDSPTWSYAWKRLAKVLHRQWNVFWHSRIETPTLRPWQLDIRIGGSDAVAQFMATLRF